jgi:crotonobetainyl-CoA:carnitine CoA-transferase CaiB-like acyl-CoA transferase
MLDGVRVVDLSRVLAGPYCTQLLADLGADVVKVEHPAGGDETRGWGPPFAGGESAYYLSVNRGKRSVALDLRDADALRACAELCARADVVVENFRAGTLERLGLGWDGLRARNPGLVLCSISGFGTDREPPGRPGYDFLVQAESGLMAITGPPGAEPHKVGVALVDVLAGLNAAAAVLAALHERHATGAGRRIEVPLADTAVAALVNVASAALVTGAEPRRFGNAHPQIVPYQPFRAADGHVAVAAGNDGLFRRLCGAIERPELAEDARFATNAERVRHRDELVPLLEEVFAARPAAEWVARLDAAGVPAGEVRGVLGALEALAAAGADPVAHVPHPTAGSVPLVRSPLRIDGARPEPGAAPPLLGEHTVEVLREAGVAEAEVAALVARGAAAVAVSGGRE